MVSWIVRIVLMLAGCGRIVRGSRCYELRRRAGNAGVIRNRTSHVFCIGFLARSLDTFLELFRQQFHRLKTDVDVRFGS